MEHGLSYVRRMFRALIDSEFGDMVRAADTETNWRKTTPHVRYDPGVCQADLGCLGSRQGESGKMCK